MNKVDNSSLTGEAEPQERFPLGNTHSNPLEATNLAFNSSLVISGEGYGSVVRTGDKTVIGQIAGLTSGQVKKPSLLSAEIERFVKIISIISFTTAFIFFGVAYANATSNKASVALNVGIFVLIAWVPQGLPATVTMLLTIAAKRMASKQVLVKDLQGVETLGAITLLATDKTGTLTRNQMTVTNIWTCLCLYSASPSIQIQSDSENSKIVLPFNSEASGIKDFLFISSLCTK